MTITKDYTTTFTNSALGYSLATKLAETYAENGWDVRVNSTTSCIIVSAFWAGNISESED